MLEKDDFIITLIALFFVLVTITPISVFLSTLVAFTSKYSLFLSAGILVFGMVVIIGIIVFLCDFIINLFK